MVSLRPENTKRGFFLGKRFDEADTTGMHLGHSVWVNLLDYSTGILPVTLCDKNIDVVDKDYKPKNEDDEKIYKNCKLPFFKFPFCFPVRFFIFPLSTFPFPVPKESGRHEDKEQEKTLRMDMRDIC